jgi:hypothetical protein
MESQGFSEGRVLIKAEKGEEEMLSFDNPFPPPI